MIRKSSSFFSRTLIKHYVTEQKVTVGFDITLVIAKQLVTLSKGILEKKTSLKNFFWIKPSDYVIAGKIDMKFSAQA